VTILTHPEEFHAEDVYIDLRETFGRRLYLKCEGFNFAGSIKLKAAREMVRAAEREGLLTPGSVIVESSSGNLGVALSVIAASRGYAFLCVTDSRCNLAARQLMEAFGGRVHTIVEPDGEGGFLGARLRHVRELCASDERYVWLNQYANAANWMAHYQTTAPAIDRAFGDLDVLFVGAGSTGTLMGCARYFDAKAGSKVKVVAVDAVGSVTFGGPAAPRLVPGVGTSVRPPLLDESLVDDVVHVAEPDTVRACHRLARRGFLFGGSTGTVVHGAIDWLERHSHGRELLAVAISADLGERYLDTVYQPNWVEQEFGLLVQKRQ
jgi:cysteine synthase A